MTQTQLFEPLSIKGIVMRLLKRILSMSLLLSIFWAASLQVAMAEMDHSSHQAMMKHKNGIKQSQPHYMIPDVTLLNQNGETVRLKEFLSNSEPYALNFIFTTCTTICPILTSSFRQMQRQLGDKADDLQVISITIDPEYDTPAVLQAYAKKVGATKNWTFLTGKFTTIESVEKAFKAYTSDKMEHKPTYLFKIKEDINWTRVEGLANGAQLADIYQTSARH
jgi:protein SCO1/2